MATVLAVAALAGGVALLAGYPVFLAYVALR
jgi:hypothetical protein